MASLRELLSAPRYEVIPAQGTEQAVADWVPAGMTVAVTASPVKGLEPTVELAEKLAARGYRVVPHLAARSVASQAHLDEIVARLTASGVDDVFVPGGDATHPAGKSSDRFVSCMNEYPPESSTRGVPCAYNGAAPSRNRHSTTPPTLMAAPSERSPFSTLVVLNGPEM